MATLTRGVCLAIPRFFAIALAELTTPRAIRPCPPSFSLANTKTVSPSAMCLPPYMVFCAVNANVFSRGSETSALIANAMLFAPILGRLGELHRLRRGLAADHVGGLVSDHQR